MQIKMRNIIAIIYHFLKNGENFTFRFLPISVHYNFDNLANWTKKIFLRNILYRARLKGPLSVFSALWLFLKKFSSKGTPWNFWCLATAWMLKNPKRSPFIFFGIETFFAKKIPKRSPSISWCFATMDVKKSESVPLLARQGRQFGSTFGFSGYCKRILDIWKSFCYFGALDMAPTYAVPGLLSFTFILTFS